MLQEEGFTLDTFRPYGAETERKRPERCCGCQAWVPSMGPRAAQAATVMPPELVHEMQTSAQPRLVWRLGAMQALNV